MKEPSCASRALRYYCTVGKGMERFLAAEVQRKLTANDVDHVTGKVFFTTSADIEKVKGLKSAERLFLLLRRQPPLAHTRMTEQLIQDQVIGEQQVWTEGLTLWRSLRPATGAPDPDRNGKDPGKSRKRKWEQGESDGQQPSCEGLGRVERRGSGVGGRGPEVERRGSGVGRRGPEVERRGSGVEARGPEVERRGSEVGERSPEVERQGSGVEGRGPELERRGSVVRGRGPEMERRGSGLETTEAHRDGLPATVECPSEGGAIPELQTAPPELQAAPVAFRVCCRSSGSIARHFSFQDLGRILGIAISKQLGWKVNLREPDLEVNVHLSDDHCVVGLPLSRLPLANRSYIKTTGLRSTVAWAMGSLAEIKPGSCVLDPMCGVGTLLLEAAVECPNSFFLGTDVDESQLEKARENVRFAELAERVELMQSSVTAIPVPSCSVDAVICDVPFGRKFGSKADMATALPAIVTEMERVLRVDGALVLLLSPALSAILKRSCPSQPVARAGQPGEPPGDAAAPLPPLQLQSVHRVSLGTADALIHTYRKVALLQEAS